ncbi:predicted protein [Sparassis crispa]|uniref:FAD dependent oxidoreductase domain-containing protein n=1 Tax=Sparassis crispa TaxID=139825 RepID=A0A401H523_9APHY|nr:predicted protein [Sparassis crispa]GBE89546.1 predicted protein [Sparassis crispa]
MAPTKPKVLIVGAGIFGLSTGYYLAEDGYDVTLFDQHPYDSEQGYTYVPTSTAASVDPNKVFRASYGDELHYQRLAYEARDVWKRWNAERGPGRELFVESGMLRIQSSSTLDDVERKTQANMAKEGLKDSQYVLSSEADVRRATDNGWGSKLRQFAIPGTEKEHYEAVLDTSAGYVHSSEACAYLAEKLRPLGAKFLFGPEKGTFSSFKFKGSGDSRKIVGIITKDEKEHPGDLVVVAGGSATPMIVPEASEVVEATAGSVLTIALPPREQAPELWDKYSAAQHPVIVGHIRDPGGGEVGPRNIYAFPRTDDGFVKVGYRVTKYTNYATLPGCSRPISIPLRPGVDDTSLPLNSVQAIKEFVSNFMPELALLPIAYTRLCFYTDTVDNSFLVDYVPGYGDSLVLCTGGSGHGAKFTPILGKYVKDVIEKKPKIELTYTWRWRAELPLGNGLEEGPSGPRRLDKQVKSTLADLTRAGL